MVYCGRMTPKLSRLWQAKYMETQEMFGCNFESMEVPIVFTHQAHQNCPNCKSVNLTSQPLALIASPIPVFFALICKACGLHWVDADEPAMMLTQEWCD